MKIYTTLCSLAFTLSAVAQQFGSIHFAQNYATFKYVDSQGNPNENLTTDIKPSYGFNFNKLFYQQFFGRFELGYKNYGAISMLSNNERINWSLHYLDVNLGGGYVLPKFKLKPYAGACMYFSHLYKADQIIGSRYYDLLSTNAIKESDYGVNFLAGVQYPFVLQYMPFTEYIAIFIEYRKVVGLYQLETNSDGASQKMYNRANAFHFGLSFFMKDTHKAKTD